MVLLYSARLSRRIVTRPGSLGPAQSVLKTTASSQRLIVSSSWAVGFLAEAGGMSPERRLSPAFSQRARFLSTAASSLSRSRATPPLGLPAEWQRRQYLPTSGATSRAY